MLDMGRGYDGWVGGGEGMVPERRQEHVPYLYSLSYLATQCINKMDKVTKCRFTMMRILLCKWSVKMRGNCWLRCHVYMISKPLIQNIYMYATQTIETPIIASLLNRHRTPERTQYIEIHKPANPLKLPNSLDN